MNCHPVWPRKNTEDINYYQEQQKGTTTDLTNIKRIRETNTNIRQLWVKWIIPWEIKAMRIYSISSEGRGNTSQFISWGQYYPDTQTGRQLQENYWPTPLMKRDIEILQILAIKSIKYRNKNNS